MRHLKLKKFEESIKYDYAVCEIELCTNESDKLSMTETRFVDFCKKHYEEYVIGEYDKKI